MRLYVAHSSDLAFTVMEGMWSCLFFGALISFVRARELFCGLPDVDPFSNRIVGGIETLPRELPWMVKLIKKGNFYCGGSLISDRHVLTAGHCVSSYIDGAPGTPVSIRGPIPNYRIMDPAKIMVEFGGHKTKNPTGTTKRPVSNIILHPQYDVFLSGNVLIQNNDIALLKFSPVKLDEAILPICLPQQGAEMPDWTIVMVSGWGSVNQETLEKPVTNLPKVLMKTALKKLPYDVCSRNVNIAKFFDPVNGFSNNKIFCLLGDDTDSCRGDSGGPASILTKQGYVITGIVSWGVGCSQPNFPAVYTQISNYMDFVSSNTRDGAFLPILQ